MGLTRALLKGMGLTEEQVGAIIDEHVATVNGLKEERDKYKDAAEKLPGVQKELDDLKKSGGDWEKKYNDEHTAFEAYKKDAESRETLEKVKSAYKALLKEQSIGEKHIDSILRVTDFGNMKLDKDGNLADQDALKKSIKEQWDGFVVTEGTKGAQVSTPPASGGTTAKTREEIMKIKDTTERQRAWAEYLTKGQK